MKIDLRLGDWRETMSDVECDSLITDPPYSARTHDGQRSAVPDGELRRALSDAYAGIDRNYCAAFVDAWRPRVRGWWVIFGDHTSNRWWLDALSDAGLYTFAPVVWAKTEAAPRFSGDGPASHCEYLAIARPKQKQYLGWGSLPGWYQAPIDIDRGGFGGPRLVGSKPETLMRAIVRDYSRPGWTIADPHCGSGTTAVACRAEGRACITSEVDPKTHAIAQARIARPFARDMFGAVSA